MVSKDRFQSSILLKFHSLNSVCLLSFSVGEIVTQDEADRRGQLYDINNHSSLFTVSSDHTVDADRKGNLLRYLNHSYNPNVEQRQVTVNGDHRLGFFANTDIEPQTELCFNYGDCFSVLTKNGKTVLKSSRAVAWMESSPEKADGKKSKKAPPKKKRPRISNGKSDKNKSKEEDVDMDESG